MAFKYPLDGVQLMSADEFLNRPDDPDGTRYELADGLLRVRTASNLQHGAMMADLACVIEGHLSANRPELFAALRPMVKVRVWDSYNLRAPDLAVARGPIPNGIELPDPVLLIDVLSNTNWPSVMSNLWAYTTIPSVQELLIVSSMGIEAQLLRRQDDGNWPANLVRIDEGEDVTLGSINLTTPLKAFYRQSGLL